MLWRGPGLSEGGQGVGAKLSGVKNLMKTVGMKWGVLGGLSLALVACGGQAVPEASDQPTVATVNGKVATWSGEGRVTAPGLLAVSSSVRSDGTFVLTLPGALEMAASTVAVDGIAARLGCKGTLQSSVPGVRGNAVMTLEAKDSSGSRATSAVNGSKSGLLSRRVNTRIWLFSDGETQLRGTVDCAAALGMSQVKELPVTVAVNAKAGWNVVELDINASATITGQVNASGSLVNSSAGSTQATFRTSEELQSQVAF